MDETPAPLPLAAAGAVSPNNTRSGRRQSTLDGFFQQATSTPTPTPTTTAAVTVPVSVKKNNAKPRQTTRTTTTTTTTTTTRKRQPKAKKASPRSTNGTSTNTKQQQEVKQPKKNRKQPYLPQGMDALTNEQRDVAKEFVVDESSSGKAEIFQGRVVQVNQVPNDDDDDDDNNNNKDGVVFLYRILYEDGDEEDMEEDDLRQAQALYRNMHQKKQENSPTKTTRKGTTTTTTTTTTKARTTTKKGTQKVAPTDNDDEEEEEIENRTDIANANANENENENIKDDPSQRGPGKRKLRSRGVVVNYNEDGGDDDLDDDDDDDEEEERSKKPRTNRQRATTKASKKAPPRRKSSKITIKDDDDDDDDNEFQMEVDGINDDDDDDSFDEDMIVDDDDEDESMDDDDFQEKPSKAKKAGARKKGSTSSNKKKGTATAATKKTKAAAVTSSDGDDSVDKSKFDAEFRTKMAKDRKSFKPNNNPQKWPKAGTYVDPVGVDPTHGIVEGILAAQVRKVGGLLQMVARENKKNKGNDKSSSRLGELTYPIRLQTACSGTDAPSIALGIIQESCAKMGMNDHDDDDDDDKKDHTFDYTHEMSCEIESFKQAYLARNFPEVPLFPDITKLTASEKVLDVYGRPQTIPDGTLFVAGTSCKDFSMLKTSYRLDIEDKGTSGETFLAAVEFLEQKQPKNALFENVDGAPWEKMQEYITGRVFLGNRNDTKAIKDAKKKADADKELTFSVNEDGRYVAEAVPRQVGIRAGAIVQGVVRSGHETIDVEPLMPDTKNNKNKNRILTLGQLAKEHKIDLEADTLVMEKKARYCTHLCKLDTKEYGLPQTRNRKYLFIWRSDDPEDDLGEYYQEILDHLKTPLLHSMDAFLLPDTHDRIRCFREALRSGPGLLVKRERAKELDFWDWNLSHVKDLTLHMVFRELSGIAERSRWLTGWDTRGRKLIAPGLWPELVDCWNMRRLDMVDCFSAAAIRDAISRDPLHHSFTWDLSQNVTRAPFRAATCGVSGCVTPGGELILPHRGRTLMGYEKLLLQGIPFSRLRLGPETEVQLSDLAGNAMSVPVVSATMLAAICAPQLRRQRESDREVLLANFALSQKYDSSNGAVLAQRGDLFAKGTRDTDAKDFVDVFHDIAKELAYDAFRSSVLCTCESSGMLTKDPKILECTGCGMAICHECSGKHAVSSHTLEIQQDFDESGPRPDAHVFERKLRCAVPSILRLSQDWEKYLSNGEGLESYSFQLQQVDRKKGHWQLIYGAWEDHGSARQVAEVRVTIGRTGTLDKDLGVAAYIRCFAPAIRHDEPHRGTLKDSARLILKCDESPSDLVPCWEVPDKTSKCRLEIVGSGEVDSQRVLVGLNDDAARSLKAHDVKAAFKPPIESRNPLTHYPPNWKTWPKTIEVAGDSRVKGTYIKMSCTHTVVLSALWRRDDDGQDQPPMYLFFKPDVLRTKLDVAVFAPTPSYTDNAEICELHDWVPENALSESKHTTEASLLKWKKIPAHLKVEVPSPSLSMIPLESFDEKVSTRTQQDSNAPVLCEMGGLTKELITSLLEYDDISGTQEIATIDLFGRSGTKNAKRLSIIAAPSLLKFAAEDKLPLSMSKWYRLLSGSTPFGHCENNVPPRPMEKWKMKADRDGAVERVYDAQESNEYYHRLSNRPKAFQVSVDRSKHTLVLRMNPQVPAHRAAAHLGGEDSGSVEVHYCLSDLSSMGEPPTKEFHVPNSDAYGESHVDGLVLPLYKRQAKALSRMLDIESGSVPFAEEERSEIVLPGIGWCLSARASKTSPLRGGVLGDAIGSGKTVVTIALILAGASKAHANRDVKSGRSSATLIVVPPGLVRQWDDERRKFTGNKLKCLTIDCTATLNKYTVEELCSTDMVIVPAGLIEETQGTHRPYTEQLSKKAKAGKIPPAPKGYSQREAPTIEGTWVRNMASGPEIYVGNKGNQRARDAQAYYGHCYSEAISKLRATKFSPSERGVPIEYFTWERIVIDECHETLVTGKSHETKDADFKEKARRGAREFLGVSQTDIAKRPLVASAGVWGLTGTPLLETEARVTELANLMGGTYLTGACHHWRKEERESGRDLFLNQQDQETRSREYRCAVQEACHSYVQNACQRNRGEQLQVQLTRHTCAVNMTPSEADAFLKGTSDLNSQSFTISPEQLGEKAGDILTLTASSQARHTALAETVDSILQEDPETKIIVFANSSYGGYDSAREALQKEAGRDFCHVSDDSSVERQNEIISWFRHVDVTELEKQRPRILLLSFEQAAGHNLQEACHNVIMYDPYYSGTDAVGDASVEEQAVGRVMRQGQKFDVNVFRIVLKGPKGEPCLDDWIVERNQDDSILRAATSNFD